MICMLNYHMIIKYNFSIGVFKSNKDIVKLLEATDFMVFSELSETTPWNHSEQVRVII